MPAQYAEFYQNTIRRSFLLSKPFVVLCACIFTLALISIAYFSKSEEENMLRISQKEISDFTPPQLTATLPSTPPVVVASKKKNEITKTSESTVSEPLSQLKTTLLTLSTPKTQTVKAKKTITNPTPPLSALPAIPQLDLEQALKAKNKTPSSSHLAVVDFKIQKSLAKDTKQAGLPRHLSHELTQAFSKTLNFRKIHPGDRFTVLYDKHQTQGKSQKGQILAAQYIGKRNQVIKVVRMNEGPHKNAFFFLDKLYETISPKSNVTLLRKPVKNGRVSSRFQLRRFHPVLKRYRPHLGVDYAAAAGTPIMASGDGKVSFVGSKGGYGNLVIIQHDKKYSTRYGHLARFAKIKVGSVVKQNQVIGYVGKTGHATGHHVHYEIRVNGKPQNPLTVALPNTPKKTAPILSKQHRREITSKAKVLFAKMDELKKQQG